MNTLLRPLFGPFFGPLLGPLVAAVPLALLAACGSTPPRGATANGEAMIYLSSPRPPSSIATCLEDKLPNARESTNAGATELAVGSGSDASYFVTLTPSGYGSVVRVTHGASSSNDPPEPELRFDVARCAT